MMHEAAVAEQERTADTEIQNVLLAMAAGASRAPSGDNLQPWTFVVDLEQRCLEVWLNDRSDRSVLNSAQRMSRLGCGAALECAVCIAESAGWSTDVHWDGGPELRLARIALTDFDPSRADGTLERLVAARTTNRQCYDGATLPSQTLATIAAATPQRDGASVRWICDRAQMDALARLAMRADVLLYGERSMLRAFLDNVRFDLPPSAPADRGLSLGTLGASAFELLTLRFLKLTRGALFNCTPGPRIFARYSRRLIRSSSGLCVVSTHGAEPADIQGGRAMLRAWLALTAQGLAVQPMMAAVMMAHTLDSGAPELIQSIGLKKLRAFVADFRATLAELGVRGTPQFMLRFGNAPAAPVRSGRLPLSELLRTGAEPASIQGSTPSR